MSRLTHFCPTHRYHRETEQNAPVQPWFRFLAPKNTLERMSSTLPLLSAPTPFRTVFHLAGSIHGLVALLAGDSCERGRAKGNGRRLLSQPIRLDSCKWYETSRQGPGSYNRFSLFRYQATGECFLRGEGS